MVVPLHLVVEHLALLRGGVGDKLRLDDLQDVVADVREFCLNLGLVVADQWQLVTLCYAGENGGRYVHNSGHSTDAGEHGARYLAGITCSTAISPLREGGMHHGQRKTTEEYFVRSRTARGTSGDASAECMVRRVLHMTRGSDIGQHTGSLQVSSVNRILSS